MTRTCTPVALLFAWCVIGACDSPEGSDRAGAVRTVVDTIAGIERVRAHGEPPAWALDTIVTLGTLGLAAGEPAADEFAWVSSVLVGPDRELYVADLGNAEIRVFDFAGELRRRIGREGSGPGEFRAIYSIQWLGDTLVAMDHGNRRIVSLSPAGDWLASRPFVARLTASPVTTRLYAVGGREVYAPEHRVTDGVTEPVWQRYDPPRDGEAWARASLPAATAFPDRVVCTMGRGLSWFDHPYANRSLAHPAPGRRVYLATSDAYRIALVDAAGDTVRILERDLASPPLDDAEWGRLEARFEAWLEDKDRTQCRPPALERPRYEPILESLMVDVHGRLWVETNVPEGTRWEVFDADGRLVASVGGFDFDRQRTVPWLSDAYVAWVSRDSLDVPHVHVARVVK